MNRSTIHRLPLLLSSLCLPLTLCAAEPGDLVSSDPPATTSAGVASNAAAPSKPTPALPPPTMEHVAYGPDANQWLNFWQAKSDKPTPLIFHIHGGGWVHGPIDAFSPREQYYLDHGISVVHITYRFTPGNPLPAPVMDAARALQFVRSKAAEWNIDPNRVILSGFSAGGCSSLWLATHPDLADPGSTDPVSRQSTCVSGAMVTGAQTTIEPDKVREWVGEAAIRHPMMRSACGFKSNEEMFTALAAHPEIAATYRDFSAINHLSTNTPPILLDYSPLTPDRSGGIHGADFGVKFKERADSLGLTNCWLKVDKDTKYTGFPGGPYKFVEMIFNSRSPGHESVGVPHGPIGQNSNSSSNAPVSAVSQTPTGPRASTPVAKTENENWMPQHENLKALAAKGGIDLYFVGDSITRCWSREGLDVWNSRFAPLRGANFGVSGDCTQHVLWRLQNGEFENVHPKLVVLLIGTNNITAHDSPDDIALAVGAILAEIRKHSPTTRILLLGVLPRRELANHPDREIVKAVNQRLSRLHDGDHVTYLDFGDKLLQPDGKMIKELTKDFVHLTPKGYEIFADAIQPSVESLLKKP